MTGWRPLEANKVRLKSIEDRIGELTTTVFGEVQRLGGFDMGRGFIATNAHGLYPRSGLAPENAVGQVNPIASKSLIRFKAGDGVYTTMAISSSQVQLVRSVSHDLKVDLAMIYKGPGPTIKSAGSIFLKQDEINSMTSFSNVIFLTPKGEKIHRDGHCGTGEFCGWSFWPSAFQTLRHFEVSFSEKCLRRMLRRRLCCDV